MAAETMRLSSHSAGFKGHPIEFMIVVDPYVGLLLRTPMDQFEPIWTYLVPFGKVWTNFNPFGPILTYLDMWTNLVPFGAV